jgi:release factor glutamine methyltransferase
MGRILDITLRFPRRALAKIYFRALAVMDTIPEFYPESDDTYLLIDALELDFAQSIPTSSEGIFSVEIGPGNGQVSKSWLKICKASGANVFHLAIDVNRHAALETVSQCSEIGSAFECVLGDMFSFMRSDVKADVIFCNPPYVPSSPINRARDIRASYAGGERGREFIDEFLPVVGQKLGRDGVFYFLLERRNDVDEVLRIAADQYGLHGTFVKDRKIRGEHLFVYRFRFSPSVSS